MAISSAMTPCRSLTHSFASRCDSACSVSDPAGETTRKQYPRSERSFGSAPGLTHDTVKSIHNTASSVASSGALPYPKRPGGSGTAARVTDEKAAPIPAPIRRSEFCFSASPADVLSVPEEVVFTFLAVLFVLPRPCTKNRPAPSSTKYLRVHPPNFPGFLSVRYPFRMTPTPSNPAPSPSVLNTSTPFARDCLIERSADRPEFMPTGAFLVAGSPTDTDGVAESPFTWSHSSSIAFASPPSAASPPPDPSARPSKACCIVRAAISIFISACALNAISYSSMSRSSVSMPDIAALASAKKRVSSLVV
mmetsp:Transcript_2725/g.10427  ORF Transcript_2725/g.10427 Transcript_2725/m.10427 type:complete len:307 (-) Transcript_2725:699-1619(-)